MDNWISVKDELPHTSSYPHTSDLVVSPILLLYSDKYGILIGCMVEYPDQSYDWHAIEISENRLVTDVTHWVPLPEAPDV